MKDSFNLSSSHWDMKKFLSDLLVMNPNCWKARGRSIEIKNKGKTCDCM